MTKGLNPHNLLEALAKKGTQTPLSDDELAAIRSLLRGDGTVREQEISSLRAELENIYQSRSWKLTAPLRGFRRKLTTRPHKAGDVVAAPEPTISNPQIIIPPAPVYVEHTMQDMPTDLPARLFAFYLPQFHAIAENNEWWGEGFTEWTNVRPAKPQFKGHIQPHEPDPNADLGYYDLTEPDVMRRQMEMARQYGIEGFCFYFYWFAGHRLLETPLLNLLDNPDIDVPFTLCWANENWSRRWDGRNQDMLIAQNHSAEDDIAFISYISKYLKDPRYRRIDGKPLLLVYRPIELPDAKATSKRWRDWCRDNGIGEIYIAYTQSFENNDPRDYGFDAAVEFPPNNSSPPDLTDRVTDVSEAFTGKVYDWDIFPTRSDNYIKPDYTLYRSVCPAWDNTARRKHDGTVFAGSTPARYAHWLHNAVVDTAQRIEKPENRLIFVNAWNEWAEGAHLEPDAANGFAYLSATRDTLCALDTQALQQLTAKADAKDKAINEKRIIVVTHDAHPMGAQILSMNLSKILQQDYGYSVDFISLGDGPIMDQYCAMENFYNLSEHAPDSGYARDLANALKQGANIAICNTTVSGLYAAILKKSGFKVICLVHELEKIIRDNQLESHADAIAAHADQIVFPADMVKSSFETFTGPLGDKAVICPQGAYKRNRFTDAAARRKAGDDLRRHLKLPQTARIVLGVGYADPRKGYDLFLSAAEKLAQTQAHIVFVWLGHHDPDTQRNYKSRVDKLLASGNLVLPGRVTDTDMYYAGADVFVLTSREDPYPSTVLESLDVGLPTIGFAGATGTTALMQAHRGQIVPAFDVDALVDACKRALITGGPNMRAEIAATFHARDDVSFPDYVGKLLMLVGVDNEKVPPRISAIVPNYNYAEFLPARIQSITDQNLPVSEIVMLDDCSSDNSRAVMDDIQSRLTVPVQRIDNTKNSGSVFAQWLKGVEAATGDYVWIAEADDLADVNFLSAVMPDLRDSNVVMAYTQSKQMGQNGDIIDSDYLAYTSDVDPRQWQDNYRRSGADEIARGLSVKNTIPNVSGVVFRRDVLLRVLQGHMDHIKRYRVAGDWAVYVHVLNHGDIVYKKDALNWHRRHEQSVTISKFGDTELAAIKDMQDYVAAHYDVPSTLQAKAADYIDELKTQFGLTTS